MGNQASKTAEAVVLEKAVLDRLRTLQVEDDLVEVNRDACSDKQDAWRLYRQPEGLPVQVLKSWQSTVLNDPKNRSVDSIPQYLAYTTSTTIQLSLCNRIPCRA